MPSRNSGFELGSVIRLRHSRLADVPEAVLGASTCWRGFFLGQGFSEASPAVGVLLASLAGQGCIELLGKKSPCWQEARGWG